MKAFNEKQDALQQIKSVFAVGDYVRIARKKEKFEKGSKQYTKNVYVIVGVEGSVFLCQKLNDVSKASGKVIKCAASQLKKVSLPEQSDVSKVAKVE